MGAAQMLLAGKPAAVIGPTVTITPATTLTHSTTDFANTSNFAASFTGGTPSSIVWSIEGQENCSASVIGGQGTSIATVRIITNDSGGDAADGICTVRCTAVIGGVTYSATATKEHILTYVESGGGKG